MISFQPMCDSFSTRARRGLIVVDWPGLATLHKRLLMTRSIAGQIALLILLVATIITFGQTSGSSAVTSATNPATSTSAPKPILLIITAHVDGSDILKFTRDGASWTHKEWDWPSEVKIDDVDWDPKSEKELEFKDQKELAFLRGYDFSSARAIAKHGRGILSLEQEDDGCEISFADSANGADTYTIEIRVQPRKGAD
jgi:hypothetical protein